MTARSIRPLRHAWGRGPAARAAGLALLGLAFMAGAYVLFFGTFVDEGDKLTGGWLIANGAVLYRDFFSHHLPLTYYWLAAAFALLGPTVLAARLAMLFYTVLAFAVLMRATRRYVLVGVVALGWGALGHLFGGQMAIYNTLAAVSLAVVLGVGFFALTSPAPPSALAAAALGVYAGLGLLSDASLSVGVAGVVLLLALHAPTRARLPLILAWLAAPLGLWLAYLLLTGSLGAAYAGIVRFNAEVYNKYYSLEPGLWVPALLRNALWGLYIWKPPFWQLDAAAFGPAIHITTVGRWLFGGFLFRLAVLLACALLVVRRRWLAAALIYGLATVTAVRIDAWFRLQPFVMVSLLAPALVLALWLEAPPVMAVGPRWRRLVRAAAVAALLALSAWPIARGLGSMFQVRDKLAYRVSFSGPTSQAEHIQALAAGRPAALGVFPGDPILNFLTGRQPVGGVLYLWPWVAEEYQSAVIADLAAEPAIVYLNVEGDVWGRPVAVYLADLQTYLAANYDNPEQSYYVTPGLR